MKPKIVLIGASTGGPGHLKKILSSLGNSFKGSIVIAQHMNSVFIPSFISQFNSELHLEVFSIDQISELRPSSVYFCPTNCQINKHHFTIAVEPSSHNDTPYNPCVDTLFLSATTFTHDADILAVLLTGIGHDGALGLSELQKHGAMCIAESEKSAIVYGMPKRAIEINPSITVKSLDEIIRAIQTFGES